MLSASHDGRDRRVDQFRFASRLIPRRGGIDNRIATMQLHDRDLVKPWLRIISTQTETAIIDRFVELMSQFQIATNDQR